MLLKIGLPTAFWILNQLNTWMSMMNSITYITLVLLAVLAGTSGQQSDDQSTDLSSPTNASGTVIRRRSPIRLTAGSNRLALMNSRFNRRPRKKNLDPDQLLEILGDFYDPNWMSIEKPQKVIGAEPDVTYLLREDAWPYKELTKAVQELNLSRELSGISGSDLFDPNVVPIFKQWLLKKASCPVKYSWEDIGTLFWPRWIRIGECASVPGTCSWPPGMHCVVTGRSNLHVLRWQCRSPKAKARRKPHKMHPKKDWYKRAESDASLLKCQWVRVPYPITSACHCTC